MSRSEAESGPSTVTVDDVDAARERRRQAEAAVDEVGESALRTVADAYDEATDLLSTYEGSATGTGDFESFVEFQNRFVSLVGGLPDDFPARDAFEEANELLDRRRLSTKHFEQARETLEPAREARETLTEREAAREHLHETCRRVRRRLSTLDDEIAANERLVELGEADLDAPTDELRDPIEAYNDAVTEAFDRFRRETASRVLLAFVRRTDAYPLVDFTTPPDSLCAYLDANPLGTEPLPTVLEYVGYSRSKLSHYVDDPTSFRTSVATNETYLSRLDASPLTVSWPPPTAGRLRRRGDELVSVVARFADASVVAQTRAVRDLSRRADYDRLRRSAVARESLSTSERTRLADGTVEAELEAYRAERDRLQSALDAVDTEW